MVPAPLRGWAGVSPRKGQVRQFGGSTERTFPPYSRAPVGAMKSPINDFGVRGSIQRRDGSELLTMSPDDPIAQVVQHAAQHGTDIGEFWLLGRASGDDGIDQTTALAEIVLSYLRCNVPFDPALGHAADELRLVRSVVAMSRAEGGTRRAAFSRPSPNCTRNHRADTSAVSPTIPRRSGGDTPIRCTWR